MSETLLTFSNAFADTVEAAAAGVVRVDARRRLPATGIVWSEDGLIMTAHHVVQRDKVKIGLPDGKSSSASVIGRDPTTDVAILRAEAGGLTPLPQQTDTVRVGQLVLALGRPGRTIQATHGIVSAYGGGWRTRAGGQVDHYLQTDVVMYPGFSGGPLVGAAGTLLGMNTSALIPGVSLALPVSTLLRVAGTLVEHGRVQRGYLGVSTQRVELPESLRQQLGQKRGLLVVSVESGSPADAGGLLLGDTLVGIADARIQSHDDLLAQLSGDRVGKKVPLQIVRGGETRTLNVKIGARP